MINRNLEIKRLAKAMSKHDWKSHVYKTCSRSPKDVWVDFGVTASAVQGLHWMTCSERVLDDMSIMRHLKDRKCPTIAAREVVFSAGGLGKFEFRCFVKDSNLIAVTDYDYNWPYVIGPSNARKALYGLGSNRRR